MTIIGVGGWIKRLMKGMVPCGLLCYVLCGTMTHVIGAYDLCIFWNCGGNVIY